MRFLDLTLPTPAENLALDEALLEEADAAAHPLETVRLWEPPRPLVVVGRSSQVELEVERAACRAAPGDVPVLRRASGGLSIVTGPGCLMYAVVLSHARHPQLRAIDAAHDFVLGEIAAALSRRLPHVARRGTSDLTLGDKKFSGNSLRAKKHALLYHGTLLYDFPLELVSRYLKHPPRAPDYRAGRSHADFIANLPLERATLVQAVVEAFGAHEAASDWPRELTSRLAHEKYSRAEWNEQR
ncbi:MAG: lipoate--protein ligase family protein [Planctomycetaceae bacterium]|nr:lipoate--protein ligase family protein [Planctomycetaceae bacterium]